MNHYKLSEKDHLDRGTCYHCGGTFDKHRCIDFACPLNLDIGNFKPTKYLWNEGSFWKRDDLEEKKEEYKKIVLSLRRSRENNEASLIRANNLWNGFSELIRKEIDEWYCDAIDSASDTLRLKNKMEMEDKLKMTLKPPNGWEFIIKDHRIFLRNKDGVTDSKGYRQGNFVYNPYDNKDISKFWFSGREFDARQIADKLVDIVSEFATIQELEIPVEAARCFVSAIFPNIFDRKNKQMSTFDFGDGNGEVAAKRHRNPDGSEGGWVADSASVSDSAYIGKDALVFGEALVSGGAEISGNAQVYGNAWVFGKACVFGKAEVFGNAEVYGNAGVFEQAKIHGNANVHGKAKVFGNAKVSGKVWVFENAEVSGKAEVFGNAKVSGNAEVFGSAWVSGDALVFGKAQVFEHTYVFGKACVFGKARIKGKSKIKKSFFRFDFNYSFVEELEEKIQEKELENEQV